MKFITISGLDGSGKSTQIKLLKNHLELQGKKVFYFHAIQFSLANNIFRKKESNQSKSVTRANIFQIALRKLFLRIDVWRFKILLNELRSKKYDYIISDRYFYDSIVNIAYLSSQSDFLKPGFKIESPNIACYLKTSPELIMQRERKPDQGLEYLQKKKNLYDQAASSWNLLIIDGNRSKEEIFEEIKRYV